LQNAIRAYLARKRVDAMRHAELEFLGMVKKKPDYKNPTSKFYKANKIRE